MPLVLAVCVNYAVGVLGLKEGSWKFCQLFGDLHEHFTSRFQRLNMHIACS